MSLLFEPGSVTKCVFESEVSDGLVPLPEILAMLDGVLESDLILESLQHEDPSILGPNARSLKRLRPRPCSDEGQKETKPKRGRRPTAARPRLRNKGKIEILRREIQSLEAELEELKRAEQDAARLEERRAESLWEIIAMKQSEEREKAESQNKALKSLLSVQCTLTTSLTGVLSEWTSLPAPELSLNV